MSENILSENMLGAHKNTTSRGLKILDDNIQGPNIAERNAKQSNLMMVKHHKLIFDPYNIVGFSVSIDSPKYESYM